METESLGKIYNKKEVLKTKEHNKHENVLSIIDHQGNANKP